MQCNHRAVRELSASSLRLGAVVLDVRLRRFRGVMRGVMKMSLSRMRVMRRGFVIAFFVVPGSLAMMMGRMLVMFGSFEMMLGSLLGHLTSFVD